jgi:hypothetical protein
MITEKLYVQDANCETGEQIVREFTPEEYAQAELDAAAFVEQQALAEAEAAAKAEAKASAEAKLAAIGLTAEEIAALSA